MWVLGGRRSRPAPVVVLLALAGLEMVVAGIVVAAVLLAYGVGLLFVLPWGIACARVTANAARQLTGAWTGEEIEDPYLPAPEPARPGPDGRYHLLGLSFRSRVLPEFMERFEWLVKDRATWRDVLWLIADPVVGVALLVVPPACVVYGFMGMLMPLVWPGAPPYAGVHVESTGVALAVLPVGTALLMFGVWARRRAMWLHAAWTRSLLAPTEASVLARTVVELDQKRAAATDWQAAEVRRIERDLHDGPQARLVALGMTISAAEEVVDDDPGAAKVLMEQAREASSTVLQELRGLVRGIHPPVLAERGLVDAVRALALDSALDVEVTAELPGALPEPVQSAAYFAVAEALANAAKHAAARHVQIDIWHHDGVLRATVTDDGHGGADPAHGSGLRGIEGRIAPFNGVLVVSSPRGGPTTVTIEMPYASGAACPSAGVRPPMTRRQLWQTVAASFIVPIALFPQGLVAGLLLIFGSGSRSWFLALYMPEQLRWATVATMLAVGLAGLPVLLRRKWWYVRRPMGALRGADRSR